MKNLNTAPEAIETLKKQVRLLDGRLEEFRVNDWTISDKDRSAYHSVKFGWINPTHELHIKLFQVITNLFSTHSLSYAAMVSRAFSYWHNAQPLPKVLDLKHMETLYLISSAYHSFIIPNLRRTTLLDGNVLSDDTITWLTNDYELDDSKNGQYIALITNDPERGALTDQELHNLHSALNYAHEKRILNQEQYTLAWMVMATGLRPSQIAKMKRSDILINKGPEGNELTLKVPLIKGEKTSRTDFWLRRAPTVLSECLEKFLLATMQKAAADTYLFLSQLKSRNIGASIKAIFNKLDTWSDRLKGPIPITPYRFRYTLATRALRQGASDYEVARLLTHRSTSCIQYYRASMPELQQPINTAIGKEMDYFARAFQGKLIRSLDEATFPDDGEQQILDFIHLTGQTLGACGTRTECHLNAPVACLSCHRFEPLEEAPWEELLEKLKEDQAMEKEERIRQINHNAMSSIVEIMALRDKREASQS